MKKIFLYTFLLLVVSCTSRQEKPIDLSGTWSFALDPDDVGIAEQWYGTALPQQIKLPGSLQEQGFGYDPDTTTRWTGAIIDSSWYTGDNYAKYRQQGNVKIPFWLQPEKHYVGVAWYQREINIPESWKNKYVELELERTHWETAVYINGNEIGTNNALQVPHRYQVSETGKVLLTIRVDNRIHIPIGENAHSISDHTQSNWNGIVGNITLTAKPVLHVDHVRVYPDINAEKAKVEIFVAGDFVHQATATVKAKSFNCVRPVELKPVTGTLEKGQQQITLELDMTGKMQTWSEYEPNLYQLQVELKSDGGTDICQTTFGMREFKADGRRFQVNNIPVFLRGTLECAIFPLTGYASMDAAYWEKIYRRCKEYGLNHVRFHSWCPPRVAFEIADREGIYLQVECGGWARVGDVESSDRWFYEESERIVKEYGNHPSFCLMAYGNEPNGPKHKEYLAEFVDYWKAKDSRRLYTSAAGWPYVPNADFWNTPRPRLQNSRSGTNFILINNQLPATDYDFQSVVESTHMPVVSHEIGQWCVYPNFKEIPKYTGLLKTKNFEIFRETLSEHHMGDLAEKFLYASGRLQTLCYKADIEAALRTPGFAGFQLLDLHDFPGQGTALIGVLDPFWDTKGYTDSEEYSSFCNRTVPLARMHQMVWINDQIFKASIEVSHFEEKKLENATVEWKISDAAGNELMSGTTNKDLPINNCIHISDIEFDLSSVEEPSQLQLSVTIAEAKAKNNWSFWVYPSGQRDNVGKPYLTSDYRQAVAHAGRGENVLYCIPENALKPEKGGDIAVGFSPIFWNSAWFLKRAPHDLGVFCDPAHPVFKLFPNEGHSDYQWWDIVTSCSAMVMDDFPADFRPLIHIIDDWFTNRKLGILFETKVGKGKMIVCSTNITDNLDQRPAAKQLRRSIESYMASDEFNPRSEIDVLLIRGLLK